MDYSKHTSLFKLLLLSFSLLTFVGCKKVTVLEPEVGKAYTTPPNIVLDFGTTPASAVTAFLNESDISSSFTLDGNKAIANGSAIRFALRDGENEFRMLFPAAKSVKFLFDDAGPQVTVTKTVESGSTVRIEGTVYDVSKPKRLVINNNSVDLDSENRFSTVIPNTDFVTISATDTLDRTSSVRYARPHVVMNNGFGVRLRKRTFDLLIEDVIGIIYNQGIDSFIKEKNPIFSTQSNGSSAVINVTRARINRPNGTFDIVNNTGKIAVTGEIPSYHIEFDARIVQPDGSASTLRGAFQAGKVAYAAEAQISLNNGKMELTVGNIDVFVLAVSKDFANFPTWLSAQLEPFFVEFTRAAVQVRVRDLYKQQTERILEIIPQDLVLQKDGKSLAPTVRPVAADTPENGLNVRLTTKATAITRGKHSIGSVYTDLGPMPKLDNITPSGKEETVGAMLSINDINQSLSASFEAGILDMTVDVGGGTLGGNAFDTYRGVVTTTSAPSMRLTNAGSKELARIKASNIQLVMSRRTPGSNSFESMFTAKFDMETAVTFGVTRDSKIEIKVTGVTSSRVKEATVSHPSMNPDTIASMIGLLIPVSTAALTNSFAPMLPLPQFPGYELELREIWVADSRKNFLGISAEMIRMANSPIKTK